MSLRCCRYCISQTIFKDIRFPSYYSFEIMFSNKMNKFHRIETAWLMNFSLNHNFIECTLENLASELRFYSPTFWLIAAVNFVVFSQHWTIEVGWDPVIFFNFNYHMITYLWGFSKCFHIPNKKKTLFLCPDYWADSNHFYFW